MGGAMKQSHLETRAALLAAGALAAVAIAWAILGLASAGEATAVGDANCDGAVNSIDALLVLQFESALLDDLPCADEADLDADGAVTSLDATLILQMEAGLCCPALSAELRLNSTIWLPTGVPHGERVIMVLYVTNEGEQPVTRRYASGQMYDFVVRDSLGQEVWRWSYGRGFTDAIEHQIFDAGKTVFYRVEWNQEDNAGDQIPPGSYTISAIDVGCSLLPPRSCDLGDSTELEILPPPDPIDCTGDSLEASLTVDGGNTSFAAGQPITLALALENCGTEPVTRTYSDSQLYDFSVRDEGGEELWRWSHGWGFTLAITERTFEPGEAVHYWVVWNQDTNDGQDVGPGTYEVFGYDAVCRHAPLEDCDLIASQTIEIVP